MKLNFPQLLTIIIFFQSCSSLKKNELIQIGGKNDAIQNAIKDFSKTSRLYKKATIFSVEALELINDDKILVVRIGKNNMKMLFNDAKIDKTNNLPSRYIENEGKLFFWWDDNYPLTRETIDVFRKYNLLQDDEGGMIKFPDFITDDAQKNVHFYFCKDNLLKYKKVITNKGIGYYDAPVVNCSSK